VTGRDGETEARRQRKRRSDGERSRNAILREAAQLATIEGIDGLSISRLAEAVGMSKSGLFAHFGSKEELQLATFEAARTLFAEQVTEPASTAPTALERLRRLTENYLRYFQSAFPGGCFFAAVTAEMDTHPGPLRDRAVEFMDDWLRGLETAARDAQAEGAIDSGEDAQQLAFELEAHLFLANAMFVISRDSTPIDHARRAIERRLAAAAGS
jgi:AcrR family transcriptional regulator